MKLNPERHQEILKAVFCHLVKKDLIEKKLIKNGENTNLIELIALAKLLNCEQAPLFIAIEAAVCKINNTELPAKRFKYLDEEQRVIDTKISVVKYKLKNLCTRLLDLQRELSNLAEQLNKEDNELDLMDNELSEFIYPIYLEAVKETFETLKLIPNF
jgi:hypothetical protein